MWVEGPDGRERGEPKIFICRCPDPPPHHNNKKEGRNPAWLSLNSQSWKLGTISCYLQGHSRQKSLSGNKYGTAPCHFLQGNFFKQYYVSQTVGNSGSYWASLSLPLEVGITAPSIFHPGSIHYIAKEKTTSNPMVPKGLVGKARKSMGERSKIHLC